MSIDSKAGWILGFLDSLEHSDSISKKQVRILKEKLISLLDDVDGYTNDDESNDSHNNNKDVVIEFNESDDLPF